MKTKTIENRLKRVIGQLQKLQEEITAERDCENVIPQFLAVKGALNAAFEEYITLSLKSCPLNDARRMKQLVTMVTKM